MNRKYVYKLFFKESFINNMLNKGWEPVQFKNTSCCMFKQSVPGKYICKLFFWDCRYESDYNRVHNQINALKNNTGIKVIPLIGGESTVNFYYVIYDKEEKLEGQYNTCLNDKCIKKIRRSLKVLIVNSLGGIVYVSSFFTLWIIRSGDNLPVALHLFGIIGLICGSIYLIGRIRQLLITRYVYIKFFKNK